MDETPAKPPVEGEVMTQIRRIIYVNDDNSDSVASSDTDAENGGGDDESEDASRDEATGAGSEAGDTNGCNYVLPLGRLYVSRGAGGDGAAITPYIVVMDLETVNQELWLVKDSYFPIGLPNDKETLLDFGGRYKFTIGKLADDLEDWKIRRIPGPRGGQSCTQAPMLSWASVEKLIKQSSMDKIVLFDRVESPQEAAAAIEKGWNEPTDSLEDFVVGSEDEDDEDENDEDYNDKN